MSRGSRPAGAFLLAAVAGCAPGTEPPPPASFLVAAGDSTVWVEGTSDGFVTHRAPILLARIDGRFHEVFVVDRDYSFEDALLVGQAVYRRDLLSGDSVLVREDPRVAEIALAWRRRHPEAVPLAPDEEMAEEPATQASTETELLDVVGPYLSYEFHLDVDAELEPHVHQTRRGVVDIRDGSEVSLAALAGPDVARRATEAGRRLFEVSLDSVRRATDARAARAREVIGAFRFDTMSFELLSVDRDVTVAFFAPGSGPRAGGYALPLGEVSIGQPGWLRADADTRPAESDSLRLRWPGSEWDVVATAQREGTTALLEVVHGSRRWRVSELPTPVHRVFRLGAVADTALTEALRRAFDAWGANLGVAPTAARPRPAASPAHPPAS